MIVVCGGGDLHLLVNKYENPDSNLQDILTMYLYEQGSVLS